MANTNPIQSDYELVALVMIMALGGALLLLTAFLRAPRHTLAPCSVQIFRPTKAAPEGAIASRFSKQRISLAGDALGQLAVNYLAFVSLASIRLWPHDNESATYFAAAAPASIRAKPLAKAW
jgi:hypothetical protein